MRFMILRRADAETESEADAAPSEKLIQAMAAYIEELTQAGVMLSGDGLKPSSQGARVKFSGGRPKVMDGPFAETKELIAGVSIFQVDTLEEAISWVKKWPTIDGHGEVEIEIRPMYEVEEFGDSASLEPMHEVGRVGEKQ